MDITSIQKLLGHQHVTTTQIYARVYDATVEADYPKAMNRIACEQMPLYRSTAAGRKLAPA